MLARTADHLYWMSRFIERAESLARMLYAHNRHARLPRATLDALGIYDLYLACHDEFSPATAFNFLAFD